MGGCIGDLQTRKGPPQGRGIACNWIRLLGFTALHLILSYKGCHSTFAPLRVGRVSLDCEVAINTHVCSEEPPLRR